MSGRRTAVAVAAVTLTASALATGSVLFLSGALMLALVLLFGWLSVRLAERSLLITCALSEANVPRGEDAELTVTVRHGGLLPVAPIVLDVRGMPDMPLTQATLRYMPRRSQSLRVAMHATHVGVYYPGVERYYLEDVFGLWQRECPCDIQCSMVVLPVPFQVEPVSFALGDSGLETLARATEDVTSPADVRAYQMGDSMKKIHWKLSLRKQELLVRRFEAPELPDVLVLMDCSRPPANAAGASEADLKDALLETAASAVAQHMQGDHSVRLPLMGEHPVTFEKHMGMPVLLENLARLDFSETDRFERVLLMETRRMRKVGATVIVAARLNGRMVDVMIRMRKMGPYVYLYLITATPDDPDMLPMIHKLQLGDVEVSYVAPVQL